MCLVPRCIIHYYIIIILYLLLLLRLKARIFCETNDEISMNVSALRASQCGCGWWGSVAGTRALQSRVFSTLLV